MARMFTLFSGSNANSTYVASGQTGILIDAGGSLKAITAGLSQYSVELSSIRALMLTHEHSDHIKGLRPFLNKTKIPLYASAEVLDYLIQSDKLPPGCTVHPIEADQTIEIGDLEVTGFHTSHDSVHSLGYRVHTPDGRKTAIATDLGTVTPDVVSHLQGCDLVMLESNYDCRMLSCSDYPYYLKRRIAAHDGHLSNDDCAAQLVHLVKSGTTRLVLAHLSQNNNMPLLAYQTTYAELTENGMTELTDFILKVAPRASAGELLVY